MKTFIYTLLLTIFLASCDKDYVRIEKIRLKGQISAVAMAPNSLNKVPTAGYTLADAAKVLIFYGSDYDLVTIKSDGSFSGRAPLGSASCVVFLTENNQFIGSLFVGGCYLLPLVGLDDDVKEINFSTLTLSGTRVIPANDPIGSTIILTDEELAFLREVDSYYEALAKNIDMDNNGTPDVMEGKLMQLYETNSFKGGTWGTDTQAPILTEPSQITLDYGIHMVGPNAWLSNTANSVAENAQLRGPANNPHSDIINSGNSYINNKEFKLNFARRSSNQQPMTYLPFDDGVYTLSIDNKELTFNYIQVNMSNYLIFAVPTLHINASNQLTSISIRYQLPNGSPVVPRNVMSSGVDVRIGEQLEIRTSTNAKYDDDYDYYTVELENPIAMSSVSTISLSYFDILGNQYNVWWSDN